MSASPVNEVIVGLGSCGIASGARKTWNALERALGSTGAKANLGITGCVGMCYLEPLVEVVHEDGSRFLYRRVNEKRAEQIVTEHVCGGKPIQKLVVDLGAEGSEDHAYMAKQRRIVLRNCGGIDPEDIEDYIAVGGYRAIRKSIEEGPEWVVSEIKASGLRGRGGAGFPTGTKWDLARRSAGTPKYVVCNADEGDPGAFMDRSTIEGDPHSVLEGMMICGFTVGATEGIIYCRAEYPLALKRLRIAIEQATGRGLLDAPLTPDGFSFHVKVKEGAGAFVCGEETALMQSVMGQRGMPKFRPPYPAQAGLWGKPTNINNVETFANVPWIIIEGAKAFASLGTEKSKGSKVFALAGRIKRGGLVEVPMGITIGEIVNDVGGGTVGKGRRLKAVQMGGPSGGCIPDSLFDTRIDYDEVTRTGAIMGSGGLVVMDDTSCMVDIARFFLDFTQKESCGKCTFCRIGTKRMLEILTRICAGEGKMEDIDLLMDLAYRIKTTSLCGLGQTAPNPVLTTIKYFRAEYETHIRDHKCLAGRCSRLTTFHITGECPGCMACLKACPTKCITGKKKEVHVIDQGKCIKCGVCRDVCKYDTVAVV